MIMGTVIGHSGQLEKKCYYTSMKKIFLFGILGFLAAACSQQPLQQQPGLQTSSTPPSASLGPAVQTTLPAAPSYNYSHKLRVGGQILLVEVVSDSKKMAEGLSGRNSMEQNQGMLFNFGDNAEADPGFWMQDMKFNLDFIWIEKNKIVGITADVAAPLPNADGKLPSIDSLPIYYSPSPVSWVLEVNAGWAKKYNIKLGDEASLLN